MFLGIESSYSAAFIRNLQSVNKFVKKSVGYRRRTRPAVECLPWNKLVNGLLLLAGYDKQHLCSFHR